MLAPTAISNLVNPGLRYVITNRYCKLHEGILWRLNINLRYLQRLNDVQPTSFIGVLGERLDLRNDGVHIETNEMRIFLDQRIEESSQGDV